MCLLWFSLCHRHFQEDEVEDGWKKGQSWLGASRVVHGCGGQLGPRSVPAVLLCRGRSWGLSHRTPVSVESGGRAEPGLAAPEEEEAAAGSWRLSLRSAVFLGGNFPKDGVKQGSLPLRSTPRPMRDES